MSNTKRDVICAYSLWIVYERVGLIIAVADVDEILHPVLFLLLWGSTLQTEGKHTDHKHVKKINIQRPHSYSCDNIYTYLGTTTLTYLLSNFLASSSTSRLSLSSSAKGSVGSRGGASPLGTVEPGSFTCRKHGQHQNYQSGALY